MTDAPQAVAVTSDGKIAQDLRCTVCGYNLRGLDPSGACPECNNPIWRCTQGDLLRFADPEWLEKLRLGMSVKLWTIVLAILGAVALAILVKVGVPQVVLFLFHLGADGLGLWAAFLITTQEPRISVEEDPVTLRKVVRACAILNFAGSVLESVGGHFVGEVWLVAVGIALQLAAVVNYFGEFIFLRRFARRVPDAALAKSTTTVMWGVAVVTAFVCAVALVAAVAGGKAMAFGNGALTIAFGIVGCPVLIAGLVFLLMYIRLLLRYRNTFAAASAESRHTSLQVVALPEGDTPPTRFS